MKKQLLLILGLYSMLSYSQVKGKNEIKLNLAYTIGGLPEISYERLIHQTSSVGIATAFAIKPVEKVEWRYIITPYYRLYFGGEQTKIKATGFFVEANAIATNQYVITYGDNTDVVKGHGYYTYFGYGGAIGGKWINKKGFLLEIYGGISRVFGVDTYASDGNDLIPRGGVTIGKRF